ncbi:uncharacterized domain 1-containing protein [Raineyella antarctica]|uniref:Uncharacterized domain 1-containing protein n=1 Tax=Raineyella antarctica TaxID=1577474 RepID=A0A1G6GF56_9ACTN|nr:hotdog fold thioesterase [Raineyella antarctica]SDB80641.1 uncharacterized domain 1-containing protein [Raineyella antarctica]
MSVPRQPSALGARLGITLLEVGAERSVATMPVEGNTQPHGLLHGGALLALGEEVASIAAGFHAHAHGKVCVGLDVSATHHRATRRGIVTATAVPKHLGGRVASYAVDIRDDHDHLVSSFAITCLLVDPRP